jgi:hypothetical protein
MIKIKCGNSLVQMEKCILHATFAQQATSFFKYCAAKNTTVYLVSKRTHEKGGDQPCHVDAKKIVCSVTIALAWSQRG